MSVSAIIRFTAAQTIATNTFTVVTNWGNPLYQDVVVWEIANPSRITIPAGYDYAWLTANLSWEAADPNDRYSDFFKNGATFDGSTTQCYRVSPIERVRTNLSVIVPVSAGDFFEVRVWQNSGGNSDIVTGNTPIFAVELFNLA